MAGHFGPDHDAKPASTTTTPKPENRTKKLLSTLGLGDDFFDPRLPKGTFSHSQYAAYRICGRAYYYKYVLNVPTRQYVAPTRGSAVHKGIEFALKRKMDLGTVPSIDEAKTFVEETFTKEAERIEDWEDNEPGKVKDSTLDLYAVFHREALARINPIAIEKGFAVKIGDVPMIGWIDLIDEQPAMDTTGLSKEEVQLAPKKLVTVDFKTSRKTWAENEVRNNTQLTVYAAVEGTPHVRVDQLVQLKKGTTYVRSESVRTPQDVAIVSEDIQETADFIRQGTFPMCDIGAWCCSTRYCAWFHLCRGRPR